MPVGIPVSVFPRFVTADEVEPPLAVMNTFPLVHRELLVASRRPATWWVRIGVGVVTIAFFFFITTSSSRGAAHPAAVGGALFSTLTVIAFIVAALSGSRSAGLPLSEENREITLGLLLLTTLRRRELVLGKLAAALLQGAAGLMVFVPVLSLALLLGGVTFNQIWMAATTVGLVLLLSNAAALYIAAIRTNDLQVILRTLGLVLGSCLPLGWIFTGIALTGELEAQQRRETAVDRPPPGWKAVAGALFWIPFLGIFLFDLLSQQGIASVFFFASPAYLLVLVLSGSSPVAFALQACGTMLVSGFLVWLTGQRLAPLQVHESNQVSSESRELLPATDRPGPERGHDKLASHARRRSNRERPPELLDRSPVLWLLHPSGDRKRFIWTAAVIMGLTGLQYAAHKLQIEYLALILVPILAANTALSFLFDFLVASHAARFFAEARTSGSLEMLLVTPHFRERATRDVWQSLRATFLKPVLVMLGLRLLGFLLSFLLVGEQRAFRMDSVFALPLFVIVALKELVSLAALAWLGLWESWHSRRPTFAATKAFVVASLLPSLFSAPFVGFRFMWTGSALVMQTAWLVIFGAIAAYAFLRLRRTFLAGAAPVELRRG